MSKAFGEIMHNYFQEHHRDLAQTMYQSRGGGIYDSYGDPYFRSSGPDMGEPKDSKIIKSTLLFPNIFQVFMKDLEHAPVAKAVSTRR